MVNTTATIQPSITPPRETLPRRLAPREGLDNHEDRNPQPVRELAAWIVRYPREPVMLTETLQVAGGLLEFSTLFIKIAYALSGG